MEAGHVEEICTMGCNLYDLLEHWLHVLHGEIVKLAHVCVPLSIDISVYGFNESMNPHWPSTALEVGPSMVASINHTW